MSYVFVSYVRENKEAVDRLCKHLMTNDIKVWLDRNEIDPGCFWKVAVRKAISQGNFFLACFSAEYNSRARSYMNEELTLAIDELRKHPIDRTWFIPILFSGEIPDRDIGAGNTLKDLQWVELNDESWDVGIGRIVRVIRPEKKELEQRVQRLIPFLSSPDVKDRRYGAEALGRVGEVAKEALPWLIKLLKDQDDDTCRIAAHTLGRLGVYAENAVPALIDALLKHCYYPPISNYVAEALGRIGKPAVPNLLELLHSENKPIRMHAIRSLELIGSRLKDIDVISDLVKMTEDQAWEVRIVAMQALGNLKLDAKLIIPLLIKMLKDRALSVRRYSAQMLRTFGLGATEAVTALVESLKKSQDDPSFSSECVFTLGRIGARSNEAVSILKEMSEADNRIVRSAAQHALKEIEERKRDPQGFGEK